MVTNFHQLYVFHTVARLGGFPRATNRRDRLTDHNVKHPSSAQRAFLGLIRYVVRGISMSPSFNPGDRLLVNRGAYRTALPALGNAVIVRDPGEPGRMSLKRIVGLPGEELRLLDGMLYIDGCHMSEPYLEGLPASPGLGDRRWELGDRECFVMGDNRAHSTDSRDFGPIAVNLMLGRVWLRYWPVRRRGRVGQ